MQVPCQLQYNGLWVAFTNLQPRCSPSMSTTFPLGPNLGHECFCPWLLTSSHAQIIRNWKAVIAKTRQHNIMTDLITNFIAKSVHRELHNLKSSCSNNAISWWKALIKILSYLINSSSSCGKLLPEQLILQQPYI